MSSNMRMLNRKCVIALMLAAGLAVPALSGEASPRPPAPDKGMKVVIEADDLSAPPGAAELQLPGAGGAPRPAPVSGGAAGIGEAGSDEFGLGQEPGVPGEAAAGGVRKLSLEECVRLAVDRNMRLKAAGQDVEAARSQLMEAKANFWPVLEYQYRTAPVPTNLNDAFNTFFDGNVTFFNSVHVGIGMPITAFGQLHYAKQLAQGGVDAARTNAEKMHNNTIYQVKQLYFGIQFAKETIKLLADATDKMKSKIDEEEAKEQPTMDPYDLLQLKGYGYEFERRLDEARQNLVLAEEGLRIQLDLEPGTAIELDTDNLKPVLASLDKEQEYVDTAVTVQPEARLLEIGVATKQRQYKLEKLKLMPKAGVGFFVDVGRTTGFVAGVQNTNDYDDPFNYTRAGVGLQVTGTIDFHGATARIRKARAEYHKAMYDGLIGRRALALDIRKAYLEAQRSRRNLVLAKKAQSVANQMMFITKINIDTGVGDAQRYGDALKYALLSRGLYFKAVFDYNLALADLEQRVGEARYAQLVPKPDIADYEAFDDDDENGFITIDEGGTNDAPATEKVQ